MQLTSSQKTLLIILAIMWALYFCGNSEEPMTNEGEVAADTAEPTVEVADDPAAPAAPAPEEDSGDEEEAAEEAAEFADIDEIDRKFSTRNQSSDGKRVMSYANGRRSFFDNPEAPNDWEKQFESIIAPGLDGNNAGFAPNDESAGAFASYQPGEARASCGSNQDCDPEDLFNADNYLPQEVNDDWFDNQYEPVSVKNRHLINVTRPIGINSIGSSKKNASHDLRGTPACPKFVVSPFLNSSIEPDINIKSLM